MPENILDALSPEDVGDLLAYLQQHVRIQLAPDAANAN
jgi:hypothetical protein